MWRGWGEGEDPRYTAFRENYGAQRYWIVSLFQVFLLQGFLIILLSAPLRLAMTVSAPDPVSVFDLLGSALILLGLVFESFGDAQLAAFKSRPENEGKVLDTGLWRYTRHPNYFGEAVLWWGFWICSLDVPESFKTIYAPLLMTFLLLKVSGVSLLEKELKQRKPEYEDYIARTPVFFPWFPRAKDETL